MPENRLDIIMAPHCLRHSFQNTLERVDVVERVIRHMFGKLPADSLRYYSHPDLRKWKEVIDMRSTLNSFTLFSHSINYGADSE